MSTLKEGDNRSRKPLKHLTESQAASRTMSGTPRHSFHAYHRTLMDSKYSTESQPDRVVSGTPRHSSHAHHRTLMDSAEYQGSRRMSSTPNGPQMYHRNPPAPAEHDRERDIRAEQGRDIVYPRPHPPPPPPPPPEMFPSGFNRRRLYTEFNGYDHNHLGIPQVSYSPGAYGTYDYAFQQRRKRHKVETGVAPVDFVPGQGRTSIGPSFGAPYQERYKADDDSPESQEMSYSYYKAKARVVPGDLAPRQGNPFATGRTSISSELEGMYPKNNEADHDSPEAREPKHEDPRTAAPRDDEQPCSLWLPEDEQHLTDLHCFVRKHCVYVFSATSEDVETRKGRKKALNLGQIGIGCLQCKSSRTKLKCSTYFPTSISGIYNATMIIQQRHFPLCPSVTREIYCEYNKLKNLTARSASTKEYWVSAAKKLGMVDTPKGVFFRSGKEPSRMPGNPGKPQTAQRSENLVRLVEPGDQAFATEYAYFVMDQMTSCVFTEADRLGKRKCHKVGFPGMACRHCYGGNGSGRFFPLTLKTFSDVSKSIHVLRNHLVKCTKAPSGMARTVNMLYERHKEEKVNNSASIYVAYQFVLSCTNLELATKQSTPFGSQKIFFDLIWKRLHPELSLGDKARGGSLKKTSSAKTAAAPNGNEAKEQTNLMQDDELQNVAKPHAQPQASEDPISADAATPHPHLQSPPIIHRSKSSSKSIPQEDESRPSKELCMIPKKRYLFSQSSLQYHQDLPPRYPQPQNQDARPYTESDVSAAMILANGFGRNPAKKSPDKPDFEEV
ncbi:hypothetical protein ACHAWF_017591 [Thalassiosira exigua]